VITFGPPRFAPCEKPPRMLVDDPLVEAGKESLVKDIRDAWDFPVEGSFGAFERFSANGISADELDEVLAICVPYM